MLARGTSFRAVARELGVSKSTAHRLAVRARLPRRQRGLARDAEQVITAGLRRGDTIYQIAREAGVSTRTVYLRKLRRLIKLAAGPLPCKEWRCPKCGLKLNINRCLGDGTP